MSKDKWWELEFSDEELDNYDEDDILEQTTMEDLRKDRSTLQIEEWE